MQIWAQIPGDIGVSIPAADRIDKNFSLEQAIGYTAEQIIGSDKRYKNHYRFDQYMDRLRSTPVHPIFAPEKNRIMHLDLGCGPGVFSWVVLGFAIANYGKKPDDIEFIGYDHAENMIRLAHLFRDRFRDRWPEYNFEGYYELDKIQKPLESKDLSDYNCIITFGHVLVQTEGNGIAMQNFIDIIRRLFPVNSCILMAVDAFSQPERQEKFGRACRELWDSLPNNGITPIDPFMENSKYRCWMYSRLSKEA